MYLDTKNLVSATSSTIITDDQLSSKSYKKARKGWKPLLKLITSTKSTKKDTSIAHPNNVNLNNSHQTLQQYTDMIAAPQTTEIAPKQKQASELYVSLPPTQTSESDSVVDKQKSKKEEIAIISSASINKVTDTSCLHCIYGRNCQHLQKQQQQQNDINKNLLLQNECGVNGLTLALSTAQAHLIEEELINLLLNYHIQ